MPAGAVGGRFGYGRVEALPQRTISRTPVTTFDQPSPPERSRLTDPRSRLGRLTGWGPAVVSVTAALAYGLYIALRTYEVDLGVYLRLGGRYVFTPHLYSIDLPNTSLLFTYPPFAALLFAPWERVFGTVDVVQTLWTLGNLAVLVGLLVVSLRLVKPDLSRNASWRLALALSLPALLLNPVLVTVGFGQVNLVVVLLVMWDLLTERRIGRWQAPLGVATGLAAAVKLTPLLFVPYLILDAPVPRRTAVRPHLRGLRARHLRRLAGVLGGLLDPGALPPGPGRRPLRRHQPEPERRPRAHQPRRRAERRPACPCSSRSPPEACGWRRWRTGVPRRCSASWSARGRASSSHPSPGPITWSGSCRLCYGSPSRPTALAGDGSWRRGRRALLVRRRSGGFPTRTRRTCTSTRGSSSPATPSSWRWSSSWSASRSSCSARCDGPGRGRPSIEPT